MAAITAAVVAVAAVFLGWLTMEIACKPCLQKGREAIDRALDPNYDPDSTSASAAAQPLLDEDPAPSATTVPKMVD